MEARPKREVPQTPADRAAEMLAWGVLALLWALTIWSLFQLPATIPVHFNGDGVADHYGEKGSLLQLPLVATALFAVLTALSNYPHILNYPTPITPANALSQYRGAIRLARGLKIVMVLAFLLLVFQTRRVAAEQTSRIGQEVHQ
ncbi:DUF1648 domain-containing protein [Hymenobacter negativus]|uniref:DUF1648 domain-containing protein n=1 Tax=Hymenobacter negativus TaxID=2795026 RepID=A0ABS3QE18_9BACT|nr:DUF1648 domain-containing protein [Hymenobacter negativus]MBO2009069.1 DUF1648 domain-containing protein [Hymenobacter negativus]